jgi:uncharacterized protein (DUF302 family)
MTLVYSLVNVIIALLNCVNMNSETVHTSYSFSKIVGMGYEEAIKYVTEEFKKEGFGILTSIDIQATLKKKIGTDLKPYTILGACNPYHAYEALQIEKELALMLPCNVIVYVNDEGRTVVSAIDPVDSMQAIENPRLGETAMVVQSKLKRVIDGL